MNLRPYQRDCIAAVESGFKDFDRQLIVVPTGGGKTVIFSHMAQRNSGLTLILAHREELIEQAAEKLHAATGIKASIEKAERYADDDAPVVVASVQTLMREKRIGRWAKNHFSLVVCDEAHHALSASWQSVLRYFDAKVLGVTATPDRGDKRNLGEFFENIAFEIGLFDLVQQGFLSRITMQSIPLEIDLREVGSTAGDYDAGQLGTTIEPYLDRIAASIAEHAAFRRTLCFLPLIATSQKFVAACRKAGINAEHIDGMSADRAEILSRFANGEFDLLSNAMLLTEGFDDPGIDCVAVLRPTRSRPLYSQMVGRGTRVAPFKSNLLLLDFLWLHERHSLVRPAHLIASDEIEADTMQEIAAAKGLPADVADDIQLDLMELASEATGQREAALRKKLEENKGKRGKVMDAADWCLANGRLDIATYEPTMKWESEAPAEKQVKYLKQAKIDPGTVRGRGHATKLLDVFFKGQKLVLASAKERAMLRRMGHPLAHEENLTRAEVRRVMGERRKAA